jgi:hypothetical protein
MPPGRHPGVRPRQPGSQVPMMTLPALCF